MICIVRFLLRRQCFGALTVVAAAAAACHCLPCCIGIRHQQPSSRRRHNEPAARPWPCNTNSAVLPRSGVDETTAHDYTSRGIPPHAPSSRQLGFLRSGSAREPRAQAGLAWLDLGFGWWSLRHCLWGGRRCPRESRGRRGRRRALLGTEALCCLLPPPADHLVGA